MLGEDICSVAAVVAVVSAMAGLLMVRTFAQLLLSLFFLPWYPCDGRAKATLIPVVMLPACQHKDSFVCALGVFVADTIVGLGCFTVLT